MGRFSPFIYIPFYFVAIYAMVMEREWIRIPGESDKKFIMVEGAIVLLFGIWIYTCHVCVECSDECSTH